MRDFDKYIINIPNYPIEGVQFKDITGLLENGEAFKDAIDEFKKFAEEVGATVIVGPESRGFLFGAPIAYSLGIGFVPYRKPGKLPIETVSISYELEYGKNTIEAHKDSIKKGDKVLIVDDLLATGGTLEAAIKLTELLGAEVVGIATLIELTKMNGRSKLHGVPFKTLLQYDID